MTVSTSLSPSLTCPFTIPSIFVSCLLSASLSLHVPSPQAGQCSALHNTLNKDLSLTCLITMVTDSIRLVSPSSVPSSTPCSLSFSPRTKLNTHTHTPHAFALSFPVKAATSQTHEKYIQVKTRCKSTLSFSSLIKVRTKTQGEESALCAETKPPISTGGGKRDVLMIVGKKREKKKELSHF